MAYDNTALQGGDGPSHVQGGHAEILLTPGDYFRNNPAEQAQYFRKNKLRPTFLHKLQVLGYSKPTQARYIEHWEEPQVKETFKIGAVITPAVGAGDEIILSIHADDMYSWADDMGGTQYGSRPRATETFIMPDRNEYRIITKNETVQPHRITVVPTDDAVNANTALTAGATAYIIGPIKAEATGQVKGLTPRVYKYTNTFAIVDDTDLTSGTMMTIKSPFKAVPNKPAYFYLRGFADAEVRHERSKGLRAVHGRTMDNASDYSEKFGKTFSIKGTEGFLQFVTSYGLDDTFANIGAYTLDDITGITSYYSDLQLPYGDIFIMQGSDMAAKTDNLLKDFVSDSTVSYVGDTYMSKALTAARMEQPEYDAKKLFVNFGFKGMHYAGYNLLFTGLNELNNPAEGFNFKQWQIAGPMGLFQNKKDDAMTPIMGYEYRANPEIGYSRENEIWRRGGAGPGSMVNKCSEFDVMEAFLRSEFGMHFSHGQWYVVQRPLA
jgi:hypothetical protein